MIEHKTRPYSVRWSGLFLSICFYVSTDSCFCQYGSVKIDFTTLWPVGSYYETSDISFDPNISWGGTWVQDSKGRTTFGYDSSVTQFDTVGKTGGSLTHNHSFLQITTTDTVSGAGVIGRENTTADASTLPQYVVVVRWHRIA